MSRTRTALRLALGAGLGLLAFAAPASAATLQVEQSAGHDYLRYAAAPGETNDLRVAPAPAGRLDFKDGGAVITSAGTACTQVSAHELRCRADAAPTLAISLGDRDDRLVIDANKPAVVGGDAGNDHLTGGPGDEGLWGGTGDDVLDGRGGADLLAGQEGTDTVRYADRTAPVSVSLVYGAIGTEGQAGEGDTVASDVERVVGGSGADSLTGNDGPNLLDGGPGADTIVGGGGADDLRGGPGADTLRSRDGAVDKVDCGGEADAVDADAIDKVSGCEATAPGAPAPGVPAPGAPGSPGTPASPFSSPFGSLTLPAKPVTLHGSHITLTVVCPEGTPGGTCTGAITLERAAGAKSRAAASRRTKRRGARVGAQDYAVRAGHRSGVRVRISRVERRRIGRRGTDRVNVYLRRTKRARQATRIGTLKVHASRRTKRHPASRGS
jgi:hypothetical protein